MIYAVLFSFLLAAGVPSVGATYVKGDFYAEFESKEKCEAALGSIKLQYGSNATVKVACEERVSSR